MDQILGSSAAKYHKVRPDPYPGMRAAGTRNPNADKESVDFSVRQDVHAGQQPGTPEHLKKYRKGHVNQPGKIQKHWGAADDAPPYAANYVYGKKTYGSEKVADVLPAQNLQGLADKFNDIKESKYASHQREPLGKGFTRNYQWPEKASQGNMAFGVPTAGLENAKEMLYPLQGAQNDTQDIQDLYKKTHGNFQPGEQRMRNYNWTVDPTEHRFGYSERKVLNGTAQALHQERLEEQYPKTTIVKKTVEDFRAVSADLLGQSKNLGQGQAKRPDDFVHGIKNVQGADPWNAARCIHGEPDLKQLLPDKDLGKSTKPNCRNVVRKEEDKYRSFGVPTIRTDIPQKPKRSVADYQVSLLVFLALS